MKNTTTTVPTLSEQYQLPIHAAISELIRERGMPQYTNYDDMYNYIVNELEAIRSMSGDTYAVFFNDFLIEIHQMLNTKFYGTKKHFSRRNQPSLRLTSKQQTIFDEHIMLVDSTINKTIDCSKLDLIISRDDLKQEGLIALTYAAQEHDADKNFRSYAIMKIRYAIFNAIARTDQQKNGYVSSLDAILNTEKETPSKVPTSFISESVEDAYEESNQTLLDIMYGIANRYPAGSTYRKGIIAIAEVNVNGRTWDEIGAILNATASQVSAWAGKSRPILFKNNILRAFFEKSDYNPDVDVVPVKKRDYSKSPKRRNRNVVSDDTDSSSEIAS